jgi:hydrogenase maturation factor
LASDRLPTGKLPAGLLAELLASAPPLSPEVLLGPAPGEDACAIEIPGGVLVAATDPITLTGSGVGPHAVWVNANDVAVMGVRPRWFLASVLLPEGTREDDVREVFEGLHRELEAIGAVLVGGHTEVTSAVRRPVIVGQMLGLSVDGRFVRTGGMRQGDVVVQVGAAPIEGSAVLASELAPRLTALPARELERARAALRDPGILVVDAALLSARLGACALHDPTEGGLSAGLHELADASGVRLVIDESQAIWFEPGLEVCRALGADPWGTLASGALLAGFSPQRVDGALEQLCAAGHVARVLGRAVEGRGVELRGGAPLRRYDRDEVARVLSLAAPASAR